MEGIIKYFAPGPRFDAMQFAEMLQDAEVPAIAVEGNNVVLDRDCLNHIQAGWLPVWVYLNKGSINNPLCTAEPTKEEMELFITTFYMPH